MNVDDICRSLTALLIDETDCSLDAEAERIGISTPLSYPDGDSVRVWITRQGDDRLHVSDFGEGWASLLGVVDHEALEPYYRETCRAYDVAWEDGRIAATCTEGEVAPLVWAVASASAKIAEGGRAVASARSAPLVEVVAAERAEPPLPTLRQAARELLREAQVDVKTRIVPGRSGHRWRFALVVPNRRSVIEPVSGWNEAQVAYARLGDLRGATDWNAYSVLDDRREYRNGLVEQARLLSQVSEVVPWSRFPGLVATMRD
jgi:hypothetical protein